MRVVVFYIKPRLAWLHSSNFIISVAVVIVRVAVFASIAIGVRESQLPPVGRVLRAALLRRRNGTLVPLFKVFTVQIACGKGIGAFECLLLPASGRLDARRRVEIRVKIAF